MKVIIISGFEIPKKGKDDLTGNFIRDCILFRRYFLTELGLLKKDILFFDPKRIKRIKLKGLIKGAREISSLYSAEPLIIYYSGHGEKSYWKLFSNQKKGSPNSYFFYHRRLLSAIKNHAAPIIVIADCCYGMSLKRELRKLKCGWLLIGLAPKNRIGYSHLFLGQITRKWLKRRIANPVYKTETGRARYIRIKSFDKKNYGLRYYGGKFHKYFYRYSFKKIKIVLREGDNLDYLCYPKK